MTQREDITRLPKWAQQRIITLENSVAYHKAKLAEGPEHSDTFADPHGTPRPLGKSAMVEFVFSTREDGSSKDYVSARKEGNKLVIYGSDSIAIYPASSNLAYVKLGRS